MLLQRQLQSSEPYRARTLEKDSNDTSQQESDNRDIPEKKNPVASRKRKRKHQDDQNSQE